MDPKWLSPSQITHDLGKGFYSLVTLDQKKIVTKRIKGAHLKLYLRPPSSSHSPHPLHPPPVPTTGIPHLSTPPASPHQPTPPASPHLSTPPEVVDKGNEDKRSELTLSWAAAQYCAVTYLCRWAGAQFCAAGAQSTFVTRNMATKIFHFYNVFSSQNG